VLVGVISDTHGLLRPEAVAVLAGVEHILHAGDVGDPAILDALRKIAPVTAIRGNVDVSGDCAWLPETELVELGGVGIYMLHDLNALDLNPVVAGVGVVISGHSHKAKIERRKGVLYFNPGSAGPKRFSLPVSVGLLEIVEGRVEARVVQL
jgi:hypothetical protein